MSQLRLIRASAGSGKTFTITSAYLRLLFKNQESFKNTLAVTFTNKATAEMKSRILSELYTISISGNKNKASKHADMLKKEFSLSDEQLAEKARNILNSILHSYSRFSVTTIDSFFQGIIRAFARESGIQYNYDLALDTRLVLEKAADTLMLKMEQDKTLLQWLGDFSEKLIEDGHSYDFRKSLIKLGKEIFNEQFLSFPKEFHEKIADREFLKNFHDELTALKISFEKQMLRFGTEGMEILKKYNIQPTDFKYKTGTVGTYFHRLSKGEYPEPGKRIMDALNDPDSCLPKEQDVAARICGAMGDGLINILEDAIQYYQKHLYASESYRLALQHFYTLGIMSDLSKAIQENSASENVFVLANAGPFLKAIIGENDTPFIYEKTGQVFRHFMIDEFQDTSGIQWENFRPLINDSLASGNYSMLVGDVKQSIYRWRNTDWKIMAAQVEKDMAGFGMNHETLHYNWRSKSNVIAFNNTLFHYAAREVKQFLDTEIGSENIAPELREYLLQLPVLAYQETAQLIPDKTALGSGYVKVEFLWDPEIKFKELSLDKLPETIENILKNGYKPKDIAIIVRKSKEGRDVFDYLNDYKLSLPENYPYTFDVLSDESSYLASSPAIQLLLKAFRYLVFPEDSLNLCAMMSDYSGLFPGADFLGIPLADKSRLFVNYAKDENFIGQLTRIMVPLKSLPPDSLLEYFISAFGLNHKPEFLPFIQAFHDCVAQFCSVQSPSIIAFLEYWEENEDKLSVSVSEQQDAVRIITIHKSKGLEYKNVILPFCDWDFDHSHMLAPVLWCDSSVVPFNKLEAIPVVYSSKLKETVFASHYYAEKVQFMVDNLNLLYVALTRAENQLFVFAPKPQKLEKISSCDILLYKLLSLPIEEKQAFPHLSFSSHWNADTGIFETGASQVAENKDEASNDEISLMPLSTYPSLSVTESLRQKTVSPFYKKSTEKQKHYGNFMHSVFQQIRTLNDIIPVIAKLNLQGLIASEEMLPLQLTIEKLLEKDPYKEWFSNQWKVMNEAGIIVPGSHQYRPDRVIIKENEAIVIDYKFGWKEKDSYIRQVQEYMDCLSSMGFNNITGFVWYVSLNKHIKIS